MPEALMPPELGPYIGYPRIKPPKMLLQENLRPPDVASQFTRGLFGENSFDEPMSVLDPQAERLNNARDLGWGAAQALNIAPFLGAVAKAKGVVTGGKLAQRGSVGIIPPSLDVTQKGKQQAKKALRAALGEGRLSGTDAFRGGSLEELQEIAQRGQLPLGGRGQYSGSNDISAALLGEGNFPVYGSGHGYIVPPTSHSPAGLAGEVYANPKTDPRTLTYLVDGNLLDFEAMKKAVFPTGLPPKSQEVLEAEQWLKTFNNSP